MPHPSGQIRWHDHAKALIEVWRQDYNHHRPHGSLGRLIPSEYATSNQVRW
ncbi:integrase core domain-containing protein [Castellaniella sp.]|uniref:integrase core domain-containing protein n=1 Tax=Castellaniella sp. TaxID=1955812 RepID=UPI003A4C5517